MISRKYLFCFFGLSLFGLSSQQNQSCIVSSFQIQQFNPSKVRANDIKRNQNDQKARGVWYEQLYTGPATVPTQSYFTDYKQEFRSYNSRTNTAQLKQTYRNGQNGTCQVSTKDQLISVSGASGGKGRYQLKEVIGGKTTTTNFWILYVDPQYQTSMVYGCRTLNPDGSCKVGAVEASFWSRSKKPLTGKQKTNSSVLALQYCIDTHTQTFTKTSHLNDCGAPNTAPGFRNDNFPILSGVAMFVILTINAIR